MPLYQYRAGEAERTFLFIHVPKTGGSAIEAYFRSIGLTGYFDPPGYAAIRRYLRVPPAHMDYPFIMRLFRLDQLYSFAVVRHPVSRLVSEYRWAMEKTRLQPEIVGADFSRYIRFMFEKYRDDENVGAGHFKPQLRFVGDKVTKIFKYEAGLDGIVRQVLRDVGLPHDEGLTLPVVNRSAVRPVTVTREDIALIGQVYADDFQAFGYDPEPARGGAPS